MMRRPRLLLAPWLAVAMALLPSRPAASAAPKTTSDRTYPWRAAAQGSQATGRLSDIAPPTGFERVATGGWGEWLRQLPLLPEGQPVLLRDGKVRGDQRHHLRVVDLDVLPYQECADSILRLRAEYLQSVGKKFAFSGMQFTRGGRAAFEAFLKRLFAYRGTLHLSADLPKPRQGALQPGDMLVMGGSPGHAVLVLDVAQSRRGRKVIIGNGFMPAQQFHVLKARDGTAWFDESDLGTALVIPPGFRFNWTHLRRFTAG